MGRRPCCEKIGLKRGPWTIEEDHRLMNFILNNGIHCWRIVPKLAGLLRCGKSCRLRWINYLRPDLKRGGFTDAEEERIMELHSQLGNRYTIISSFIKKKMKHLGLDPATHEPMNNITDQTESNQITKPNMCSTTKEGEETKEQTLKDKVDIGSLFEMQGNEISISESSSNFAEDSISLEPWDLSYMMDPLLPWDFFTNLDDNIFL
ncbi:hypothetical protein Bca52824_006379 [Brassica carinata]|uniref:Uncharacterized protein n=1 Tax=Brassica carinata TaxID=52824 RepID=A0A8X8BDS3_BRACI|nr:hypothetical protein Bca52824_006379 [Brassica carinata]